MDFIPGCSKFWHKTKNETYRYPCKDWFYMAVLVINLKRNKISSTKNFEYVFMCTFSERSIGSSGSQSRGYNPQKVKNSCSRGINSVNTFANHLTPRLLLLVTVSFPDLYFSGHKKKIIVTQVFREGPRNIIRVHY